MTSERVVVDGRTLSVEDVAAVARGGATVELDPAAAERVRRARLLVERHAQGPQAVYGINTGFGFLKNVRISSADLGQLQLNLIRSHAVGVGPPLGVPETRALMLLRANAMATGRSGVRAETIEHLLTLLNARIHPVIPAKGSVGASGDLAPLAHLALAMIGEGWVWTARGEREPSGPVLARANLRPLQLGPKEGLCLVNGTQAMGALGCLALIDAEALAIAADIAGALTLEGRRGTVVAFDARIQNARGHPGQRTSAENLRRLLAESEIARSHADCEAVQDPYSLRCMPQVHGATRDVLTFVRNTLAIELNAGTDNPLVFAEEAEGEALLSGGNFHGQPLAFALDFLAIAVSELASISDRRVEQLIDPALSGLPPFLIERSGLNSGFMMAQVTAASLVNENRILSTPASVDSIPTSANQEDHVSMGMTSARKAAEVVTNTRTCLAIELLCAAQAIDLVGLAPGRGAAAAHRAIRARVPKLEEDRVLYPDIEAVSGLIEGGALRAAVEAEVGPLG
ncbi:MAG: histidine ammonia-lyase [Deltaproteobacteria bacterium]|nr:histidine ammonia-lyase [Deltaproteobacteria bacterium]